jgi:hypothetical protein
MSVEQYIATKGLVLSQFSEATGRSIRVFVSKLSPDIISTESRRCIVSGGIVPLLVLALDGIG